MWRLGDGLFIFEGSSGSHSVIWKGSGAFCTCLGYLFRGRCRHLKEVGGVIDVDELEGKEVKKYRSSLGALNELVGDEFYNPNFIIAVYGEPKVGKTLLMLQDAFWLASQGGRVLYLDTEGSLEHLRKWKQVFEARFGKGGGKVFYDRCLTIESLLKKFGIIAEIERKEKKSEFRVKSVEESEVKEVDYVFLDSVSAPFRMLTSNQQDFPVRADATGALMLGLMRLMEREGCGIVMSVHASFNPANPFESEVRMRGGSVIEYFAKRVIYIDKREAKELSDYRRIWLVRGESDRAWSKAIAVKISAVGFEDVKKGEMEKCFTEKERKKVSL